MFPYILAFLLPHAQAQATCFDGKAAQEVRREIDVPCNEKLIDALTLLKTPLPNVQSPFSRNHLPANAWTYLTTRIRKIVNEPTCPMGKMASVHPTEPGLMRVCPSFYDDGLSKIERLALILHEAHHFDGDGFIHAHCEQGRLKGMRYACDASFEDGGGYAIELEALVRLAQIRDLPEDLRAHARKMALERATENFNQQILPYRLESIYLEGTDGKGYLLDPELKGAIEVAPINRAAHNIVSRGASLLAFPRGEGDAYTLDVLSPALTPKPAVGSIALAFNGEPADKRARILAILNDDLFTGDVSAHRASVALAPNTYETEVEFPFTATAFFTGRELGQDENSFYLRDENGGLNRVELKPGRNHELHPPAPFPAGFQTFLYFQGRRLALTADGVLVELDARNVGKPVPALQEKRFSFASRPFYWAPSLFEDEGRQTR